MIDLNIEMNTSEEINETKIWDSVIVGGGPAGYNAAMYLARKGFEPLMIIGSKGGQLPQTNEIENYLGHEMISGFDMSSLFERQIKNFGVPMMDYEFVSQITKEDDLFELELMSKKKVKAKTVIIASGGAHRKLGVVGEDLLSGKGISYCAICDAPFFKKKEVVVVGGGDSAVEAVIDLSKWADHVHLVHRSTFRAEKILLDKMFQLENITYELGSVIEEIQGGLSVESVVIYNKEKDERVVREVDGVFIEIGQDPQVDFVRDLVLLNEQDEIVVDRDQRTNVEGMFAAGDVTDNPHNQIIIAASEGAIAALSASDYLLKKED